MPGDYTVSFKKDGFGSAITGSRTPFRVHIGSGGDLVPLSAELTQLATVSGRVLDSEGHPIPNLAVQLSTASRMSHIMLLSSRDTDKEGRFTFAKMWPGAYLLEALPVESSLRGVIAVNGAPPKKVEERKPPAPPPSVKGQRWMWVNTFYPGVVERGQAERIVVRPGWEMTGYDIRLRAVPVYRVRGVVFGEDGKRAAGVAVGITAADRLEHDSDGVKSGEDGTFEFPSVHQGDWRLMALYQKRDQPLSREPGLRGFAEAMVARHDLENLVIHLSSPFSVSGVVEREEPRDAKGNRETTSVVLESATHGWGASARHQQDGTFRIDNIYPDRYRIGTYGAPPGFYVESIRLGENDVTGQGVELTPASPPLRIVYRAGAGRVRGTVENGGGATVVLLPRNEALLTNQFIRSAKCDGDGRYEIGSLKPGDYYLLAFPQADLTALEDPDFVRPLAAQAVSVQVDNGRVTPADLKVTPWPE